MNPHLKTAYVAGAKQAQQDFAQAPLARLLPNSDAAYLQELTAPPPAPLDMNERARLEQLEQLMRAGRRSKNPLVKLTAGVAPKAIQALIQKDTLNELAPTTSV
jgi:hypothetical protein